MRAAPLAERARNELLAAGARPRKQILTGVAALTPIERQAATLGAQGMSNPQIAQALFISRKTVEKRLSDAYRKLKITSRNDLPAALGTPTRRGQASSRIAQPLLPRREHHHPPGPQSFASQLLARLLQISVMT